jgi:hypothetical protein
MIFWGIVHAKSRIAVVSRTRASWLAASDGPHGLTVLNARGGTEAVSSIRRIYANWPVPRFDAYEGMCTCPTRLERTGRDRHCLILELDPAKSQQCTFRRPESYGRTQATPQ